MEKLNLITEENYQLTTWLDILRVALVIGDLSKPSYHWIPMKVGRTSINFDEVINLMKACIYKSARMDRDYPFPITHEKVLYSFVDYLAAASQEKDFDIARLEWLPLFVFQLTNFEVRLEFLVQFVELMEIDFTKFRRAFKKYRFNSDVRDAYTKLFTHDAPGKSTLNHRLFNSLPHVDPTIPSAKFQMMESSIAFYEIGTCLEIPNLVNKGLELAEKINRLGE